MEPETETISTKTLKNNDPGIIYLSRIPKFMSVKKLKQMLEIYGEIGRVFLQPNERASARKKSRSFTEGWVEFNSKKVAKSVAATLNNNQIGGKRRSPWYDELWNMKYLPKFKWGHLNERLAYEREVHKQKLRTEIAQAKRETNFYIENVERKKVLARKEKRKKSETETKESETKQSESGLNKESSERLWSFTQTEPDIESEKEKRSKRKISAVKSSPGNKRVKTNSDKSKTGAPTRACDNKSFLKNLFSGGLNKGSVN